MNNRNSNNYSLMEITQHQPTAQPTAQSTAQYSAQPTPTFATYIDYTSTKLTCTPFEQKTIPGTGQQATPPSPPQFYYQIPLMYNFGTDDVRILNDFVFEACELNSSVGIQSKPGQSGRLEHSIMCKFDANNAGHSRFIETIGQIHAGCAYILSQMKGGVKLFNFDPKMAEATGLKNPVYRARDQVTGEIVQGRAPSMFLKLFSRGTGPLAEQTLFTGLDGKPVPWTLLQGVEMKFIPLIHVKRLYVGGGKASIQMEVVSAVITDIRARNTTTRQLSTIHGLISANPALADTVAAQLAKLTIDRQDQMLGAAPHQVQHGDNESQPTYAGIAPTGRIQATPAQGGYTGQVTATQASPGVLPTIPPLAGAQAMQDFTANAPTRDPVIPAVSVPGLNPGAHSPGTATLQLN